MESPPLQVLQDQTLEQIPTTVNVLPYDNDVTLLYKWAEVFQVPIQLTVVRPRTDADIDVFTASKNYVFESLPLVVERMVATGNTPADIFEYVSNYNKVITLDDVMMVYYDTLVRNLPESDPNLYQVINDMYRQADPSTVVDRYEDSNNIVSAYNAWTTNIEIEFERDMKRLYTIYDIQEALFNVSQTPDLPFSPVNVNTTISSFTPTYNNIPVTIEDGLDIFNRAITSKYVPYIRYNDKYGSPKFKVYIGDKAEDRPKTSNIIIPSSSSDNKNTIYMTLWLGDPDSDGSAALNEAPREAFYTVVYHLDTNYLTVESPIGADPKKGLITDENVAYQRTMDALPSLNFGVGKEVKVRGEFNIWGIDFDESSFLHMVLLEPVMNVYLYVEENIKPFALKKRLDVHYRSIYSDMAEGKTVTEDAYISNSASVSVTLNQRKATHDEIVNMVDMKTGNVTQGRLDAGRSYLHVNITQAESRNVVEEFIPIFNLLMKYYISSRQDIINIYNTLLPELNNLPDLLSRKRYKPQVEEQTVLQLGKKSSSNRKLDSKLKRLQEVAGDLFVDNYARRCQQKLQPMIIEPDEVETWKQRRVGYMQHERQIMAYPYDNPKWLMVCDDDENPYPGVKTNTFFNNKDKYPYIPCCFKTDHMAPGRKSKYNAYISGIPADRKKGAKAETKIKTSKILTPDKIAFLPRAVADTVKHYSDDYIDMVRYGIIYSTNSLLHCVCTAIDDPNYFAQPTDTLKENYVIRIRQHILATINPSLLKQELYDYSDTEIMEAIADNNVFFNPALFYRAVEETYDINIYTFYSPLAKAGETELGSLDIPRFKIFHSRPLRLNRPTVVILKTWGSESDTLDYPQCELIVDLDEDNLQIVKLFGPEMTSVCHGALQEQMKTMTWSVDLNTNMFDVHSNIYYYIDHLNLFQLPPVSQYIDGNGKMRALTFDIGDGQYMTVATIPSQPENVPVSDEMYPVSIDIAVKIFGEPNSVTRNNNGELTGLWFQIMDIPNGEYVPVIPTQGYDDKLLGPPNPIVTTGENITSRLSRLRRTLDIIVQLTRWLYELAKTKEKIDPHGFADKYMYMDQRPIEDSASYYDLTNIPRRLPNVENIQDAIRILEQLAPTLFNNGHIVMYNAAFADRIVKMLQDYTNLRYGMQPEHIEFLENYFETETDFLPVPHSKIFMNEHDLDAWLNSLKSLQNYSQFFSIRNTVTTSLRTNTDPYLYQDINGKIYIIQNVLGGTIDKAFSVAQNWYQFKVNIGYEPTPLESTPYHMLYGISASSTLVPIEDHTFDQNNYYNILYYGSRSDRMLGKEGRYAAMLEIL